jgi:DNA-directed RNA polymerase alpha subunit
MTNVRLFDPTADLPDDTLEEAERFRTRIYNALTNAGVKTLGEIRESSEETLASFPDLGRGSVQ